MSTSRARGRCRALALVVAVVSAIAGCRPASIAEPVTLFTGTFITLAPDAPRVEALAVQTASGRILATGSAETLRARFAPTTTVALPGVVVPGFADPHIHTLRLGEQLEKLDLRGLQKAAILDLVAREAARLLPGEWILGGGWEHGLWSPAVFPTAADLDRVAPAHPVLLNRIDLHSAWLNSAALTQAGITAATRDPDGGRILRDGKGVPTGMLVDRAVALADRAMPPLTHERRAQRMKAAFAQMARWGLTSIHDAGAALDEIEVYKTLLAKGELPLRAYVMARGPAATEHYLVHGPEIGLGGDLLTIRSFKVMVDGALGSRGAQLNVPYADEPGATGLELASDSELRSIVSGAVASGFQVNAHAIGDRAVHRVLNAFDAAGGTPDDKRARRFRVEHASLVDEADLPRFAALGVIASLQPNVAGEYGRFAETRVGAARARQVLRTRDLMQAGARIAAGSDYPAASSGDPVITLYSMVTRMGAQATPPGGWHPDQRATVDEALSAMTAGAAFASFRERDLGALTAGRYADLTVLSADPYAVAPEGLNTLKVVMTLVGGKVIYP